MPKPDEGHAFRRAWAFFWLICIVAPYFIAFKFSWLLPKISAVLFSLLSSRFGPELVSVAVVIFSILLYCLRLAHQTIYGVLEIFIAQVGINIAVAGPVSQDKTTETLLKLLAGMYVVIRGLDNLEKGLKDKHKDLWNIFFAEEKLRLRRMFLLALLFVANGLLLPSLIELPFVISGFAVFLLLALNDFTRFLMRPKD